jgi:hypothetical protein
MEYVLEYKAGEREQILNNHKDKYLIAEKNLADGNYLIFTTEPPVTKQIKTLEAALLELSTLSSIQEQKDKETEQAILELTMLIGGSA